MVTDSQKPIKVSVLMPVYNAEKYVGGAIESILNQTFRDFEFIIVDDGSTDASAAIIRSCRDPRIIYIENSTNVGIVASLNKGLALARGDYIARMDADDISMPIRLEKQVDFLIHNERIGLVGSAVRIINEIGRPCGIGIFPQENSLIQWTMCFSNPFAHGTIMMRRDVVLSVGGYPTSDAEDYDLWEKLGYTTAFSNLPDVLLKLRRHEESLISPGSNRTPILKDSTLISLRRITKTLDKEVPISLVEKMWGTPFQKSEDALHIAELIHRLASVSTADIQLMMRERRNIENDAARRLLKTLARSNITPNHRWQIFRMAFGLDPYVIARVIVKRINRSIRNLSLA